MAGFVPTSGISTCSYESGRRAATFDPGFIPGTVRKKMVLTVISTRGEDGERNYSIKA